MFRKENNNNNKEGGRVFDMICDLFRIFLRECKIN